MLHKGFDFSNVTTIFEKQNIFMYEKTTTHACSLSMVRTANCHGTKPAR
jgi:hypothetical protein